jgi:hypothetical protein
MRKLFHFLAHSLLLNRLSFSDLFYGSEPGVATVLGLVKYGYAVIDLCYLAQAFEINRWGSVTIFVKAPVASSIS